MYMEEFTNKTSLYKAKTFGTTHFSSRPLFRLHGTGKQVYSAIFTRKESTGQGKYKRNSEQ
jgi:hypothetical protein